MYLLHQVGGEAKKVINTKVAKEEPHLQMEKTHVLTGISQL